MRLRSFAPLTLLLPLAACGDPEPLSIEKNEARNPGTGGATLCEPGEGSRSLTTAGSLAGAAFWDCSVPRDGDESALRFDAATGPSASVNGGRIPLKLTLAGTGELAGRDLLVNVRGERGYFVLPAPPLEVDGSISLDLYVAQTARIGTMRVAIAIDDGTGTDGAQHPGRWIEIDRELIPVKGGDVQFNVSWDSLADVDLYITDPAGEEISFSHRTSNSGGELDLDSNESCTRGFSVENVYWPTGGAPEGEYIVSLALYSACGGTEPSVYRGTLLLGGAVVETFDGELAPSQANDKIELTRFTWPPP